jgi:tRNA (guanosine-2'-O-)-methyltransferase
MADLQLISYLEQFVSENRRANFKQVLEKRTKHFTVAIEDIYQPHNASAVVRSCDIFGLQTVNVIQNKYAFHASNRVARGAQKWLDFNYFKEKNTNNSLTCIEHLRQKGYQIIATTPHNDSCLLPQFDINKPAAFFFGVEKQGLSNDVLSNADGFLKIPMVGFTESLNISVAAAIILYNVTERLRKSTINWQFSEAEKTAYYLLWLEKSIKNISKIKEHFYTEIVNSR